MKSYSYFPGCSCSEGSGIAYNISTQEIVKSLDIELLELEDWNCCGTTPYESLDELESACLAARNLALAKQKGLDLVTPCSACYLTLNKVNRRLQEYPWLRGKVNEVLAAEGLNYYGGEIRIRHLMELLLDKDTLEILSTMLWRKLTGLKVAPYYGCMMVRPGYGFDNPREPSSLHQLIEAVGAEVASFPLQTSCCGGAFIISEPDLALDLIRKILTSVQESGAHCIVTPCPLCQTNLDAYQGSVNSKFGTEFNIPVLFVSQLIGFALGKSSTDLGLEKGVVSAADLVGSYTPKRKPGLYPSLYFYARNLYLYAKIFSGLKNG
jgi:heterodisulfide reductase subunit B